MTTTHTPGPWTIRRTMGGTEIQNRDLDARIATVHAPHLDPTPETVANATLIAAAPELLEALRVGLAWSDDGTPEDAMSPEEVTFRTLAHAALAKAEGRS